MFLPRLFSTVILLAIFLSAFLIQGGIGLFLFIILGLGLSVLSVYELGNLLQRMGYPRFKLFPEVFTAFAFIYVLSNQVKYNFTNGILVAIAILMVYCWLRVLNSKFDKEIVLKSAITVFNILIVLIPVICITLIYTYGYKVSFVGMKLALFLVIITKIGDMGAYCSGTLASKRPGGNHSIVPKISPKKSWEGTIGGLIITVIATFIIYNLLGLNEFNDSFFFIFTSGVVLFIGGFIGDLTESILKRMADIKDSGSLIPGIGGVLDLTDSLFINAPLFFILLKLFGYI